MKILFTSLFLFSVTLLSAQGDYTATIFVGDPVQDCLGDSNTILFWIMDSGMNANATNYTITSSSMDISLHAGSTPLSGTVNNGESFFFIPAGFKIDEMATPGTYSIDITLSCDGCMDPDSVVSYMFEVQAAPDVYIDDLIGTTVCDSDPVFLNANDSSGATGISYLWSTLEMTQLISTDTAGIFWVTSTNACGSSSDTVMVTSEITPIIDSSSCEVTPGQLAAFVQAHDADGTGLTFQWFENGNPIEDTLDYSITTTDSSSLLIVSSNDSVSHNNDAYTWRVSNACGTVQALVPCFGILPINLIFFEGENIEGHVNLTWATATETNNDYFEIERSVDAIHFEKIGTMTGAGNSNTILEYHYTDRTISSDKHKVFYYRIKQVDYDGTFSYSDIININILSNSNFSINSAYFVQNLLNLNISNDEAQLIHWSLFSMDGKLLYTEKKNIPVGQSNLNYQFNDLSPGIYLISVSAKDFQKSLKISR